MAIVVEKGKASSPARIAGRLGNPKDILFLPFFPQFIHLTNSFGCSLGVLTAVWVPIDLSVLSLYILAVRRWLTARCAKRLTRVSALFCYFWRSMGWDITCGSYIFSKGKTAGDQRADNQQDQDELKTIAPQHGALQKNGAEDSADIVSHNLTREIKQPVVQLV